MEKGLQSLPEKKQQEKLLLLLVVLVEGKTSPQSMLNKLHILIW
jgi:hypothetical protein